MNFNKVILAGRLTRDPDLKVVGSDLSICNLGLAVNRVSGSGEKRKEEVCFVDAVAWRKQAEVIHKYLSKGDQIFIEGRLTFEQWDAKDGSGKRSKLKVTIEKFEFVDSAEKKPKVDPGF